MTTIIKKKTKKLTTVEEVKDTIENDFKEDKYAHIGWDLERNGALDLLERQQKELDFNRVRYMSSARK